MHIIILLYWQLQRKILLLMCMVNVCFHISSAADVSCPTLEVNNNNLTYSISGNNKGDIANFSCNGDLVLVGESMLTCSSGSWSADVPTCRECVCVFVCVCVCVYIRTCTGYIPHNVLLSTTDFERHVHIHRRCF